jgi:hypothetical protein
MAAGICGSTSETTSAIASRHAHQRANLILTRRVSPVFGQIVIT